MSINYDSSINQRIKQKFVDREVYSCATGMVEYILSKSWDDSNAPFSYDDIENYYKPKCSECGSSYGFKEVERDIMNDDEEHVPTDGYECENCGEFFAEDDYNDLDTEPQEIYEWWQVNDMLARDLIAKGEPVINDGFGYIWGRTCTGQSIMLDYVIGEICKDMGILEGQENDWSKWL